jgi:hypothetical protein
MDILRSSARRRQSVASVQHNTGRVTVQELTPTNALPVKEPTA